MELFESAWSRVEGLPPPDHEVCAGSAVAGYKLTRELGRGEFAVVQECTDGSACYAIKHISKRNLVCRKSTVCGSMVATIEQNEPIICAQKMDETTISAVHSRRSARLTGVMSP